MDCTRVENDKPHFCALGIFQWLRGLNRKYRSKQNTDTSKSWLFIDLNSRDTTVVDPDLELRGNLRNHDGDAEDNVGWKMNLYFTHESRDTLKSFSLFLTVKITSELNMEHSVKFGI